MVRENRMFPILAKEKDLGVIYRMWKLHLWVFRNR